MKLLQRYNAFPLSVRASLWYIVCNFVQKGMSVITIPIFTRILSKAEYGELNVYNSWYMVLTIVVALAMGSGMHMQGLVKFSEKRDSFTAALQGLTLTLVLGWGLIYVPFRSFWNGLLSLNTIQMSAMLVNIWTSAVFGLWANTQRVEYRYRALLVVTVIGSLLKPVVEIFMVFHFEDRVSAKVVGAALLELAAFGWLFFVQIRKGKCFFSAEIWKYALVFCIPLVPHYLSQTLLNQADRIMIRNILGPEEAGDYGLAYSVSLVLSIMVTALGQSVSPWIYEKIKAKKEKDIGGIIYLLMLMLAAVSLLLIVFAPEVIAVFAPGSYSGGVRCIPPVTIGIYFTFCYTNYVKFALYYEKKLGFVLITVVCAILNIVANQIFIPIFGYVAAGYTTMFSYMIYSILQYLLMRKICREECEGRYPMDTRILLLIQGGFVAVALLMSLCYDYMLLRYGVALLILLILLWKRKPLLKTMKALKAGKQEA